MARDKNVDSKGRNATQALEAEVKVAKALIEQLQRRVAHYEAVAYTGTRNWGYAGDVEGINETLRGLVRED